MADTTTASYLLKYVYEPTYIELLPTEVAAWNMFQKVPSMTWEGKDYITVALHSGRNYGAGFVRELGPLPEPQPQTGINMRIPCRFGYSRIFLSGVSMKVSKTNKGAYKQTFSLESEGARTDFTDLMNQIMWADGRGIQALKNGAATDTTELIVDAPGGVPGAVNGARFLNRGQKIAILSADGSAVLAVRRVTEVGFAGTNDGNRVTVNSPLSAVQAPDNAIIVLAPTMNITEVADAHFNLDPMGMRGHIDDGEFVNNYHGINRTEQDICRSTVIGSVGALNTDVMQQALDVASQLGNSMIREYWCEHSVRRAYQAILSANRMYISSGGANDHDGGFKGQALTKDVEFSGYPVKVDRDCDYDIMYFVDKRWFKRYENTPGQWVDKGGDVLRPIMGQDAYEAVFEWAGNFANQNSHASAKLSGISTNKVVVHVR